MDGIHLSLAPPFDRFVDEQVASGGYPDAGAYVRALVEAAARAEAKARLEALLLEGLEGPFTPWTEADGEALQRLAVAGK